ncbi:tetratricopeptide repeat protein [Povalibacter sp.]|uniref:tetratricopeptide repeat protein n=1 Tax=Povalibacter sp. TaxID=1962978 RepID=UPI002F3EC860
MNRWRIVGLLLLAALVAWLTLRSCTPEDVPNEAPPATATPARDKFHASRPLQVSAIAAQPADPAWLERELRHLLLRGRMQVAPVGPDARSAYTLRIEVQPAPATTAVMKLVAPDDVVEREEQIDIGARALDTLRAFATTLPAFLDAAHAQGDWVALIGTDDPDAYDTYLSSANELLGADGRGFTQPAMTVASASVERLEALTRKRPGFARARSLLAIAYLGLGGKDVGSLTALAETTAERALALDPALANAQSALGLVSLRRGDWATALDHFRTALQTDPNATAALEGLGCLLMDVGHATQALPITQRAVTLQPANVGANECLAYARLATGTVDDGTHHSNALDVALVEALEAMLSGQTADAQRALHNAETTRNSSAWVEPLLRAANNRRETAQALQAITRAANDQLIDPVTELICGAALRQSDFVFNRMLRLHKQNAAVPLRILWLPNTAFLRKHDGFAEIVSVEGLLPFWQDHGLPDICKTEPAVYGCKLRPQKIKKPE